MTSLWSNGWTGRAFFMQSPSGGDSHIVPNQEGDQDGGMRLRKIAFCASVMVAMAITTSVGAEEQSAGEAAGAGDSREVETPPAVICGGCDAHLAGEGKGSIVPYGRIELDGIYSNGTPTRSIRASSMAYATAAGKSSNASSTLNPRYSVFGLRADRTDGTHSLTGVVEADFYSQTDNAGNISPACGWRTSNTLPTIVGPPSRPVWIGRRSCPPIRT